MTMNLDKQDAFLNNIAARLGRQRKSGVKPPLWNSKPYEHLYQGKTKEELITQYIDNLAQLNTEVDRITRGEFGSTLEAVLQKFGIRSAIFWDDSHLDDLHLAQSLKNSGIEAIRWDADAPEAELRAAAARVDLGITWADMGLAETGTVVFGNGGGRGRVVSLLPPVYLCILAESSIVPRLTQAVAHVHDKVPDGLPACINFITGPSRTGDIEMDLALGVHGPGKVHVILLRD